MKKILALGVLLMSVSAFADNRGVLDGRTYCRTIVSGGVFGQPAGERQHCLRFSDGGVSDNANTFFGNPPESWDRYDVNGRKVVFGAYEYTVSPDGAFLTSVKGSAAAGIVFSLKK